MYYETKKIPSISTGILAGDSIYWLGVRGLIDIENSVPASVNSVYRIASISKSITAVAVMQLWEKGLVNLDEDVRKYVPYFPQKKWTITIRQLLNHTSGIRSYKEGEFHSKNFYTSTREALKVFENDTLKFKPGSDYLYTTLGYTLLAAVIESTSKKNYAAYINENILQPAGMNFTYVDVQREIIPNRARGYIKNSLRKIENAQLADLSIKVAGGGFISTSNDILLFIKGLFNGTLIRRSTLDTMLVPTRISRTL
jgi:Beta-lactamase class C and other penicillin binding proteins